MNSKNIYRVVVLGLGLGGALEASATEWQWKGDLRYRFERNETDLASDAAASEDKADPDDRHRIRARAGFSAKIRDNFLVNFRLASGGAGAGTATSSNQTLSDGFSTKGFGLDRAYFDLKQDFGLWVKGGKMGISFQRPGESDLIFDDDISPEGLALGYSRAFGPINMQLGVGNYFLNDGKATATTSDYLQVVAGYDAGIVNLNLGYMAYNFGKTKNRALVGGSSKGNSTTTDSSGVTVYGNDYKLANIFLEAKFDLGVPLSFYYDSINNSEADKNNKGSQIGIAAGAGKGETKWWIGVFNRNLESDATIGSLTDSNFGGTAVRGNKVVLKYALSDNSKFGVNYFAAEKFWTDAQDKEQTQKFAISQMDYAINF